MIQTDAVKVDRMEMPYAKIGEGEKNLLIIPGLSVKPVTPMAAAVAGAYQLFWEKDYTIYLVDPRTNPFEGYTNWDAAEDLFTALKEIGVEKPDVFGASQGGMIAQCLAILHPEIVRKLVLASTMPIWNETSDETIGKWIRLAEEKKERELIEDIGSHCYSETSWKRFGESYIGAFGTITEEEYGRFLHMAKAIVHFDCADRLKEIKCPVFAIGAEGDRVLTPEGTRKISEILNCECYMYGKEFGHAVYDEAPDYIERLYQFYSGGTK